MPASSFARAAFTLAAVIASFLSVFALCRFFGESSQPAIVAALMAISFANRRPAHPARPIVHALTIAAIAPFAAGVGWLLHTVPLAGAVVFVAVIAGSVYARNFGPTTRAIGAVAALPIVAILIVPPPQIGRGGVPGDLAIVVAAGLIALAYTRIASRAAARAGLRAAAEAEPSARPNAKKTPGVPVPTRMALQMAVALTGAFAVGFGAFPGHWGWSVLTAFIVCSGARGRGDAAYKGVLRLLGAAGGTLTAAAISAAWAPAGLGEGVAIFVVLYFGLLLRDVNYAYWACAMTLILALISRGGERFDPELLELRLLAILGGALCAVAAAWFVYPIRTEAVIRRRLADALAALDDLIAHGDGGEAGHVERLARFEHRFRELEGVAAPVEWHRRLMRTRGGNEHPALWIDRARNVRDAVHALPADASSASDRASIRRAIGLSRRAIAEHGKPDTPAGGLTVTTALDAVHDLVTRVPPLAAHSDIR